MSANRVELRGTVQAAARSRTTPGGKAVLGFTLRVDPEPGDEGAQGFSIPVVWLGTSREEIPAGEDVHVVGFLTERRWSGPGGASRARFEIVARSVLGAGRKSKP